jgi:hypothetical protein
MADERITTESVAPNALETDPIVLRESETRCYLVVGRIASLPGEYAKRSFELFRTAQAAVQILTFDEVRERLQGVREVLTTSDPGEGVGKT